MHMQAVFHFSFVVFCLLKLKFIWTHSLNGNNKNNSLVFVIRFFGVYTTDAISLEFIWKMKMFFFSYCCCYCFILQSYTNSLVSHKNAYFSYFSLSFLFFLWHIFSFRIYIAGLVNAVTHTIFTGKTIGK